MLVCAENRMALIELGVDQAGSAIPMEVGNWLDRQNRTLWSVD